MSYYGNVNIDILENVNSNAHIICEFGCGEGVLARAVKDKIPGAIYIGFEIFESALSKASDILDHEFLCDLDNLENEESKDGFLDIIPDNSLDCVICGDVLEHLKYPEKILNFANRKLKSGGQIIVCIPNVQNWSVFIQLARGTWPREDSGIFDATHLRWFTLKDMAQLLIDNNFNVEKLIPRIFDQENPKKVAMALRDLASVAGADYDELSDLIMPLQYVYCALKK